MYPIIHFKNNPTLDFLTNVIQNLDLYSFQPLVRINEKQSSGDNWEQSLPSHFLLLDMIQALS
jgi:hypothetical protein